MINRIGLAMDSLVSSCGSREPAAELHIGVGVRGTGAAVGVGMGAEVSVGGRRETVGVGEGSRRGEQAAGPKRNATRMTSTTA